MPTYAVVTRAPAEEVSAAIRSGGIGGYVVPDPLGTSVLFDAPRGLVVFSRKLVRPARALVRSTGVPAWVLLADEGYAEAYLVTPGKRPTSLHWMADWQPPTDPAAYITYRKSWDAYCAALAREYGEPDRGAALAAVRNDPIPGRPAIPLSDLLRRVCRVFDLPEAAVGRSLLAHEEPGLFDAIRVDVHRRRGLVARLTGRAG